MDGMTAAEYRKQLFIELIEIVAELGWNVGIPEDVEEGEEVPGLIIGERDYVDSILEKIDKED
jgi:hypothetical protein